MKSIYGGGAGCIKPTQINITPLKLSLPSFFDKMLTALHVLVDRLIVVKLSGRINALDAELAGYAILPVQIRVRLAWVHTYPGTEFDDKNTSHLNQIKDIYLSYGADWHIDPFFS